MNENENELEPTEPVSAPEPAPELVVDREAESHAANVAFDAAEDDDMADLDGAGADDAEEIDPELVRLLEAVLFASSEPVSERALTRRLPEGVNLKPLLRVLMENYTARGIVLQRRGGSWAFRTAPDLGSRLNLEVEVSRKLSRAAIETLAIIAYHQPVTRGEIEEIRGVSLSKGTLDLLFDEGWIKPRGHRDTPGRPMLWGTTDNFLDHFDLQSVSQLPGLKDLRAMGLLDARPSIEAYTSRGTMQSKEEVQENMQFSESQIQHAEHHVEDGERVGPENEAAPLIVTAEEAEPEPEEEMDHSGATKITADKLDAAMAEVAVAVKSAVKALEKDDEDDDENGDDGA